MASTRRNLVSSDYQQAVESVVYLATLVTQPRHIDQALDTLREITSRNAGQSQPSSADVARLAELQTQIRDYLINGEPLRLFTKESLDRHLQARFGGDHRRHYLLARLALFLCAVILLAPIPFLAPGAFHTSPVFISLAFVFTTWNRGGGYFLLQAIREYVPAMQDALVKMSLGLLLIGVAQIQLPILGLCNAWHSEWVRIGGEIIPFLPAFIFMYFGANHFSRLVAIRSWLQSWYLLAAGGLVLFAAIWLAGSMPASVTMPAYATQLVVATYEVVFSGAAAFLMYGVMRRISKFYAPGVRWIVVALITTLASSLGFFVAGITNGANSTGAGTLSVWVLSLCASAAWLTAGYTFTRLSKY